MLPADKQKQHIADIETKYKKVKDCLNEFLKSRLSYVVEKTLKHIELSVFLDHIVLMEHDIYFQEFREMILSIFGETALEITVLLNANRSANRQQISLINRDLNKKETGFMVRYRKCMLCKKYLDEVRLVDFNTHNDEDLSQPFIDPFTDGISMFECGHTFHSKCISSHKTTVTKVV